MMNRDYWFKQTVTSPLFPELIWSRPENRQLAGKLLIIGGNLHSFASPAKVFHEALIAGVGFARVLLPDAIKTLFGSRPNVMDMEFAPSTPSGSFAISALENFISLSQWADGVLLAGDIGQNSETTVLLEKFISKYSGQLTMAGDSIDCLTNAFLQILQRDQTTLVLSLAQLQRLVMQVHFTKPITSTMDLLRLVEALHEFTDIYPINIVVKYDQTTLVAVNKQVSSTKLTDNDWEVKTAALVAVWWLQNPDQTFKALSSCLITGESSQNT